MANIKQWLLEFEKEVGEDIEAIVVGVHDRRFLGKPLTDEHIVLTREVGLSKLDEEFNAGFSGADCFPMYAWTKSFVAFVGEYDGATDLDTVPRHPIACEPGFK